MAVVRLNESSVDYMVKTSRHAYLWLICQRNFLCDHLSVFTNSFQVLSSGLIQGIETMGVSWDQEQFRDKYQRLIQRQAKS